MPDHFFRPLNLDWSCSVVSEVRKELDAFAVCSLSVCAFAGMRLQWQRCHELSQVGLSRIAQTLAAADLRGGVRLRDSPPCGGTIWLQKPWYFSTLMYPIGQISSSDRKLRYQR